MYDRILLHGFSESLLWLYSFATLPFDFYFEITKFKHFFLLFYQI